MHDRRRKGGTADNYPTPEANCGRLSFATQNDWRDRFAAFRSKTRADIFRGAIIRTSPLSGCWKPSPITAQRILLTLATGTGKTFIAFQLAWKLFHSRWNLSRENRPNRRRPRILFLADRNILAESGLQRLFRLSRRRAGAH
jgi:type I restriction enzyme R subunit